MAKSMPGMRQVRQFLLVLGCALAAAAYARGTPGPVTWKFTDLGTLGGLSIATAVNNRGDVAGYSDKPTGGDPSIATDAFMWSNGVMRDLGRPPRTNQGVLVLDMNEKGDLVGTTLQAGNAVVFRDRRWTELGFPGVVRSINKFGDLAGNSGNGLSEHAFVIRNNVFWDLGTFGGARSWAHAINDRGQAVGFSMTADGVSHAFSWERGRMKDLGTFGGLYAEAVDIDDNGQILVAVEDSDSRFYPLLINSRGVATRPFMMAGNQIPRAMNNRGDFVGSFLEQGGSAYRGFVYYDRTLLLLDQMPAVVASALTDVQPTAINDRGWIVGRGIDASSQYRAFLLVPSR